MIEFARKALELDPTLAEAHAILADAYQQQWQWSNAESEYKRALELNPNSAEIHLSFASWLMCEGRLEEAVAWARRGRELDPLEVSGQGVGWILFQSRRYDEAIRELRSDLAARPDNPGSQWFLGFALIANGHPEEAVPILERAAALTHRGPAIVGVLIRAYAHSGRRPEALRLLQELKQRQQKGYIPAAAFLNAYLGIDDKEQAFVWLERGYQEQSMIMQYLRVHPYFDPIRKDPRFADLLHRVGLDHDRPDRVRP
jgi:Tfp pilus assembly protein PilF